MWIYDEKLNTLRPPCDEALIVAKLPDGLDNWQKARTSAKVGAAAAVGAFVAGPIGAGLTAAAAAYLLSDD